MTITTLEHPDAAITIEELDKGKRRITVVPGSDDLFVSKNTWITSYPVSLIRELLTVRGPGGLCDEIMRDEDPNYVQRSLEYSLLAYVDEEFFRNARVLDFGCGKGSSTLVLSRMFPDAEVVGVELMAEFVSIAKKRADYYGSENVTFLVSPDEKSLPDGLGAFDAVILHAVFEHLLPDERTTVLPLVWTHLKSGGILFLNQTPYRYFPIEGHTTNLPLINYMPDNLTLFFARKFCKKTGPDANWDTLLREGIRGGTAKEIVGILEQTPDKPILLQPDRLGVKDRVEIWFKVSGANRMSPLKRLVFMAIKCLKAVTGLELVAYLSLAIRKE
jgi:SAM-dependent methyltransferase